MRILAIMLFLTGHIFATDFTKKLEGEVLFLKKDQLEKGKADFGSKEIFVVYYSHSGCGPCVPFTKKLNEWYKTNNKTDSKVQLIFATRGDETPEKLRRYIYKSKIQYPIMDVKFHVDADINNKAAHQFYEDADMGVPRLRFFDKNGFEIYIKKHVKSIYDMKEVYSKLDEILKKISKK